MDREFDVIVWGATGFTGRLVAEYICQTYGVNKSLSWTIAGRSLSKLQLIKEKLQQIDPLSESLELILADSFDEVKLREMVSRTKVICSTVGPYLEYGSALVSMCVEEQTDYCDLTGETPFVRAMIDKHHDVAKEKKIKIVHSCGYDSIPSDLGVLFLQQEMLKKHGEYASEIRFYTGPTKGGLSGGTLASMAGLLSQAVEDRNIRKILGNPYSLNPKDGYKGNDKRDQTTIKFDRKANKWTAPFMMAGTNTRIVRRSHALQAYEYGEKFLYSEVMGFPKGFRGWRKSFMVATILGIVIALMLRPTSRKLLQRYVLPKQGEGPNKRDRESGYFTVDLLAIQEGKEVWARVYDNLDPGYGSTSKMLAESAVALALQSEQLPQQYGIVTPAVALGMPLVERLKSAGMEFSITR